MNIHNILYGQIEIRFKVSQNRTIAYPYSNSSISISDDPYQFNIVLIEYLVYSIVNRLYPIHQINILCINHIYNLSLILLIPISNEIFPIQSSRSISTRIENTIFHLLTCTDSLYVSTPFITKQI